MFCFGPATRIYVAVGATDMRKSFEGLHGLVREQLQCSPLSGHVFLFCNACLVQDTSLRKVITNQDYILLKKVLNQQFWTALLVYLICAGLFVFGVLSYLIIERSIEPGLRKSHLRAASEESRLI